MPYSDVRYTSARVAVRSMLALELHVVAMSFWTKLVLAFTFSLVLLHSNTSDRLISDPLTAKVDKVVPRQLCLGHRLLPRIWRHWGRPSSTESIAPLP